ncbi:MAG: hypothetical protein GXP45_01580 [bacterium]|nr:hypothetical protein [bacterium]
MKYDGLLIMSNRAYSQRFRKKYKQACQTALGNRLLSLGKKSPRDILVPRKGKKHSYERYYHLFSRREIQRLAQEAGFSIISLFFYVDKQ